MAVMDEFKQQRDYIKTAPLKEKIAYYYEYYRYPVFAVILIVGILFSIIYNAVTRKDTALNAILLNSVAITEEEPTYPMEFMEYAGLNPKKEEVILDTSLFTNVGGELSEEAVASSQKLLVRLSARELDVLVTDTHNVMAYSYNDYLYDLRDFLTPEQIERFEPYFLYMEPKTMQLLKEAMTLDTEFTMTYPDPRNPEEIEDPIPVAIDISSCKAFRENYYFVNGDVVFAAFVNTTRPENAVKFLEFLARDME